MRLIILFLLPLFFLTGTPAPGGREKDADKYRLLVAADSLRETERYDSALVLYRMYLAGIPVTGTDDENTYAALLHKAECHINLGETDSAAPILQQLDGIRAPAVLNNKKLQRETQYVRGRLEYENDNYSRSLEILDKVMPFIDNSEALLLSKVNLYRANNHACLCEYNVARKLYFQALCAIKSVHRKQYLESAVHYCMGSALLKISEYDSALYHLNLSLLERSRRLDPDRPELFDLYYAIAYCYYQKKDYYKALEYLLPAGKYYEDTSVARDVYYYSVQQMTGYIYKAAGDYEEAVSYYSKAGMTPVNVANLADCYAFSGNGSAAKECYLKCFEKGIRDSADYVVSRLKYGNYCLRTDDLEQSYIQYKIALSYNRVNNNSPYLKTENFIGLASFFIKTDNLDSACTYLKNVFQLSKEIVFRDKHYNKQHYAFYIQSEALQLSGDVFSRYALREKRDSVRIFLYKKALRCYRKAIDMYEDRKSEFRADETGLLVSSQQETLYKTAVITALRLGALTGDKRYNTLALQYAEMSKYSVLLASIGRNNALKALDAPDSLLNRLALLKDSLYMGKDMMRNSTGAGNRASYGSMESEYDLLERQLEKEYPAYRLARQKNERLDIAGIQKRLSPDQAALDYVLFDSSLVVFYIDNACMDVFVSKKARRAESLVAELRSFLACDRMGYTSDSIFMRYISAAYELYGLLIKPFEHRIAGRKVCIVPDGVLCYLPFEVLITKKAPVHDASYNDLHYFIAHTTVSYSYSLHLLNHRDPVHRDRYRLLAFAPEYSDSSHFDFLDEHIYKSGKKFTSLPYGREEITEIGRYFGGREIYGGEATRKLFCEQAGKYDILHFATHTVIDDNFPMYSKIVFSGNDSTGHESCLNTYEIYNMELDADLVVLSGCRTGYGKLFKGEGISGLANGFVHAGCRSLVCTLWEQEDMLAKDLIVRFYRNLSEGMKKSEALGKAKTDYLASCNPQFADPHCWAGFILIGEDTPLSGATGFRAIYFVLAGMLVLLTVGWIVWRKRR
ncbi:MAG: CHAT domain-containing protein [Bacteroidetes bacterium]|nr:CHAT domain-containing protein [Bacteroidota bacterium]